MVKILIVEDEYLMRERLVKAIDWSLIGCEVIGQAENGFEAVEIIGKQAPDIVITDIKMPHMDGLELSQYIAENYDFVKVLIMTGYSDFSYAQKAIKAGVKDYILKPSDKEEILCCVEKVAGLIREERKKVEGNKKTDNTAATEEKSNLLLKKPILDALEYINKHYMEDVSLTKVADYIHVHPVYLGRMLRKELGESFSDIVLKVRIESAKKLLKDLNIRTYEVAYNIGICDPHYFSQVFKKYTGMTPTEYRESLMAKKL